MTLTVIKVVKWSCLLGLGTKTTLQSLGTKTTLLGLVNILLCVKKG